MTRIDRSMPPAPGVLRSFDFPAVERFHDLKRDGDLAEPDTAAKKVWKAIESGLASGSVVDIRDS